MKRILTVLFILLPCLAMLGENRQIFEISLVLWPIVTVVLVVIKAKEYKNSNLKNIDIDIDFEEKENK